MSPDTFELTPTERATLVHALRVAAGVFDDDAVRAAERGLSAVVQIRQRQAAEAREIADRLEDARYVRVGREVADSPLGSVPYTRPMAPCWSIVLTASRLEREAESKAAKLASSAVCAVDIKHGQAQERD